MLALREELVAWTTLTGAVSGMVHWEENSFERPPTVTVPL
jgi:hypothetical protein